MIVFRRHDWPPFRLLPFLEATLAPVLAVALHVWGAPGHFALWFLPMLIALRYGVAFGLYSLLLFGGGLLAVGISWGPLDWAAGASFVLASGWLSDIQLSRLEQERKLREITEERLQGAMAQLYLAQATAKSLQSHWLTQEATLLSAVEAWVRKVPAEQEGPLWNHLLSLLLPLAQINVCGLFRYLPDQWRFELEAVACHGVIGPLREQDPLIVRLLEEPTLGRYLSVADLLEGERSQYLAVVPMRWQRELLGVLVIRDMPARQLNERTLKLLQALLTIAAWAFTVRQRDEEQIWSAFPDMPLDFFSLLLLAVELRQIGLPSLLVLFRLERAPSRWRLQSVLKNRLTAPLMADWVRAEWLVRLLLLKSFPEVERDLEALAATLGQQAVVEVVEVPPRQIELFSLLERIFR